MYHASFSHYTNTQFKWIHPLSQSHESTKAPVQPYSPKLASNDFLPFGELRTKLADASFKSFKDFISEIWWVSSEFDDHMIISVSRYVIPRLELVMKNKITISFLSKKFGLPILVIGEKKNSRIQTFGHPSISYT